MADHVNKLKRILVIKHPRYWGHNATYTKPAGVPITDQEEDLLSVIADPNTPNDKRWTAHLIIVELMESFFDEKTRRQADQRLFNLNGTNAPENPYVGWTFVRERDPDIPKSNEQQIVYVIRKLWDED